MNLNNKCVASFKQAPTIHNYSPHPGVVEKACLFSINCHVGEALNMPVRPRGLNGTAFIAYRIKKERERSSFSFI